MPRDSNGLYTLPTGNPVSDGDLIEADWANATVGDIAVQLNNLLTKDGLIGPGEPFLLTNGSVLAPSLAFVTQPNLGFYRSAVNAMSVTANGVNSIKFASDSVDSFQPLGVADGTVTAPSFKISSEVTTGFFKDGPGKLAVAIGGVNVFQFMATGINLPGNVGVGGNVGVIGNLAVTGNIDVNGALSVKGVPVASIPTGAIIDYAGATPPAGYLLCDGAAVSRTTYAVLFAAIGVVWGGGNGSTTFNVPDLRRYITMGSGGTKSPNGSGPAITLGSRDGFEVTAINTLHMPAHTHTISDPTHVHSIADPGHIHGVSDPGHQHAIASGGANSGNGAFADATYRNTAQSNTGYTGISIANNGSNITINGASTGITTQSNGSGSQFNNCQPSAVVHKIIKT